MDLFPLILGFVRASHSEVSGLGTGGEGAKGIDSPPLCVPYFLSPGRVDIHVAPEIRLTAAEERVPAQVAWSADSQLAIRF